MTTHTPTAALAAPTRAGHHRSAERQSTPSSSTVLLWGTHDGLFTAEEQIRLAAAVPNAQLVVYDDIGHCPNWERPDRVAADIAAFVTGTVPT